MYRIVTLVVALTVTSTMLVGGAMAQTQSSEQVAVSGVDQEQDVSQLNVNEQDDNVAASIAVGASDGDGGNNVGGRDNSGAESGDAVAIQASAQSNENVQYAESNAQNFNGQVQNDDSDGGRDIGGGR